MRRKIHVGLGVPLVLILVGAVAFAAAGGRTIEVSGHGEAKAKPDTMMLSFVVDAKGVNADESTNLLTQRAKTLADALKPQVGDKGSVATSDFSIRNYGGANSELASVAWSCVGIITAETYDIAPVGKLVEAGMKAGAQLMGTRLGSKKVRTGIFSTTRMRTMTISLRFEVQTADADECTRKGSALDQRIEQALRNQLHGNGSVALRAFRLNPLGHGFSRENGSQETSTVFDARETVSVNSKDLGLLGPIIDAAYKAGASLNSVTFTLGADAAARTEAIRLASADAQAKAAAVANSMGVKLGPAIRISTNAQASPQEVYGMQGGSLGARASMSAMISAPERVVPREVGYNADVNVTYEIE
ncbi:MAG TPA: SIMPL domain-containing protein [Candidatus Binataceae bacterium]|nr:SIMPL domain-containing protein [Candidatus Binataceae bacterium]